MPKNTPAKKAKPTEVGTKRKYLSQSDVPIFGIDEALRVPQALVDNYPSGTATVLQAATALDMSPTSGTFRNLCGSAIAYGLTSGGPQAKGITLEPLGKRILKPVKEGDELVAKRDAVLRPRVIGDFLRQYQGSTLPRRDIGLNVLAEMGVPRERVESVYTLILDTAQSVGFIREIKGKQYVDLTGVSPPSTSQNKDEEQPEEAPFQDDEQETGRKVPPVERQPLRPPPNQINRRVFITHGKNKAFIEPIKKLLAFGEMIPIVSVERQTVSKPVPDKVMDDMRSCGAAIIHVDEEQRLIDKDAKETVVVNQNVLIEIGAAMALYGRRFILLVKDGVALPSNLSGLYEVRYKSDALDGDTTIKLLEAIKDIKTHQAPERYSEPKMDE